MFSSEPRSPGASLAGEVYVLLEVTSQACSECWSFGLYIQSQATQCQQIGRLQLQASIYTSRNLLMLLFLILKNS